ncbi:aminotransferase class I/II-fold pyridoxal phosphate-dependent enzyme [Deinococcus detaillensis]|uniref:Aminotransferase class I/II-fold pyridoxal phosphate-dependent enzyme n=1 Tax=Deinococcus detaillensis TaxID=2592048 RepID=A0A553URZ3_9DEIO|nr:aminotransferase class I/II-fold pyridoxal phosphate-dependent enzyme [Deinococcus detaillensis]TSA82990.1 aminotransferase class I/II-fold pyridoxal phosphate-dependent enzyme [Deinococcus detaillensis]
MTTSHPTGNSTQAQYAALKAKNLKLNMQRGQPSDADFDLSNGLLTILGEGDYMAGKLDTRNYPGGVQGLPEARELFGKYLDVKAANIIVWNNASLELQGFVLTAALLHGLKGSPKPWVRLEGKPKMIVTVPGYDRHFLLLETLGFELLTVEMQDDGPDVDAIEKLVSDELVKGLLFVPTYSNPGGESISAAKAQRLASLKAAAPDFTIFADDAYRVHHLFEDDRDMPVNLVQLCAEAGHPDRAVVFASTSKITLAGAGLGFMASSEANIAYLSKLLNAQSIGPNKVEQLRHVKFFEQYPGGVEGLMRRHAALLAPKFQAVHDVLSAELGEGGQYASWKSPKGGYFVSLDTALPVAERVVELAEQAGVSLTPAGATYPGGKDPHNRNIRLSPSRPPVAEVREAMQAVALCIKLASEEYRARQ